jgi:hypothetical protein
METILILIVTLIVLDMLALKWGAITRDGVSESPISFD